MKKAIFLVEDIQENRPITLPEKILGKNVADYDISVGYREIGAMLYNAPSDYITFKKVYEFMSEIGSGPLPADHDVFYLVLTFSHIFQIDPSYFLLMDHDVKKFLLKHDIPLVFDSTNEGNRTHLGFHTLFKRMNQTAMSHEILPLLKLKFYLVGGERLDNVSDDFSKNIDLQDYTHLSDLVGRDPSFYYAYFPSPFFFQMCHGHDNFTIAEETRDYAKERMVNFDFNDSFPIWKAYVARPRLSRIIFEILSVKFDIRKYGIFRYQESRFQYYHNMQYERLLDKMDFFNKYSVDKNLIHTMMPAQKLVYNQSYDVDRPIDYDPLYRPNYYRPRGGNGVPFIRNSLTFVALETNWIDHDFSVNKGYQTGTILTEKTSTSIISGVPFITCGAGNSKMILEEFGFQEYPSLELPDESHSYYLTECEYVVNKIKHITRLSLDEKKKLYKEWLPIILHNYETFFNVDIKYHYLKNLNQAAKLQPKYH